jgi:WD40 repeat protein
VSPSRTKALVELLKSLFATDELYRFAALLPYGNVTPALPSAPASLEAIAFELVQVLERRGQIDGAFFFRLEEERPGRKAEIAWVRTQILDSHPKQPDIIDFTGERGRHEHFFGRQDILHEFYEWGRGRASGWLLLTGSPGLGKSAIFNHWLGLREQAGLPTAFHFIRRGIHNWADPSVVRASLAAQIERDFPEQRDADADGQHRLEQLLYRMSPVLEQRQQELVLLVDGLDEAMTLGGADNPIPRIFPHELPMRVFVFAASRPLYPHLNWFTRRTGATRAIDLDGRSGNLETVREFWATLRGTLAPPPADDLVRVAIERSEGNMLHAVKLHQLWSQPGAERSINAIPQGFEGMLSELWERLGNLPEEQWEIARQGLSLLCAARQGLPLCVIDELLEWSEGNARHKLLPLVRELLHEERWHEQPAYRPFHEGLRELIEREFPEMLCKHHRRLARFAAWPPTGSEFRHSYALRHRVVHQVEGRQFEQAAASCYDVGYLTAKARALGVLEIEREIRLAARVQEPTTREHLMTLALTVGACSHWVRQAPEALPTLLHDRLLSYAPVVYDELIWSTNLRQIGPLLRHPLQNGSLAGVLTGHQGFVNAVAVLPDGSVVSGSPDYTLRVWDVAGGQAIAVLEGHHGPVNAVAALPDGRIASGSDDHSLRVWDVASGQAIVVLEGHHGPIKTVAALPDGRIVSGSDDHTLRVWDVASNQVIATLEGHQGAVMAVAVLPNGRIVSGSQDKTLRIWDLETKQITATLEGHHGSVQAVAITSNSVIVSGSSDESLRVWDVTSSQVIATLKSHHGPVNAVVLLPNGLIVSGSDDHSLQVWDGQRVCATLEGHHGPVNTVAVLPNGLVVSGSKDHTLRVWDVATWIDGADSLNSGAQGQEPSRVPVVDLVDGAGGNWAVAERRRWSFLGVSAPTGTALPATLEGHQGPVYAVAVLSHYRVITGSQDKTVRVWDITGGQAVATITGHQRRVWAVAALPRGRIVSGSRDNTLRVWDVESGQALATLMGHQDGVTGMAVLSDGRVVSGSQDNTLRVWDVESGQTIATLLGHQGGVTSIAMLPDGCIVSGSQDKTLRVWDIESGQTIATLLGHQDAVTAIAALPSGCIVSGSQDKTLRVWDIESGQTIATLLGHQGAVTAIAALPNGCVVSGSRDNTLRIWDVASGQTIASVYGETSFRSLAVVDQHLIVAGDAVGNVWFIDLPEFLLGFRVAALPASR